ncbi:MAG TPA: YihY/virulence factor BrkB family protein [Flavisolibacter sp.]
MKRFIRDTAPLFGRALGELLRTDPLRMAGATAFFTTFALPPILVILIQSLKLVIPSKTIRSELLESLSGIIGHEAGSQVADVLLALRKLAQNWYMTLAGFIFLVFVATTLFKVIKNSINQVWKIRAVRRRPFSQELLARVKSVLIILVAGVLFVTGLLVEGLQAFIGESIYDFSPALSLYFNTFLNNLVSIVIVMLWFALVFRYLPDGRPGWKVALAGAFVTSLLFAAGRVILQWLLTYSNVNTLYGTSASIVLLLLFVFYTSLILYYGAAFTRVWATHRRKPIEPLPYAMHYHVTYTVNEEA